MPATTSRHTASNRLAVVSMGQRARAGFTLLELLVVMVILGLLAGLVGPTLFGRLQDARSQTAHMQAIELEQATDLFKLDVGRYPSNSEGLDALANRPSNAPGWKGPYLRKGLPLDPWGRAYHYANPGRHGQIDIFSLGADDAPGGDGENADVGNWN